MMKVERAHRLCGAEAAEDGERPAPGLQRGGVEPSPGPAVPGGNVGAQVEAGGAEHARVVGRELALQAQPRRVSVGPRGGSCGHVGSPRRFSITRKMAASFAPGSSGASASPLGIAGDGDRSWEGENGAMGSGAEATGRVRRARWGAEQRGGCRGCEGRGAEPCTVNVYTIVLSNNRDIRPLLMQENSLDDLYQQQSHFHLLQVPQVEYSDCMNRY
jgi:hypothetical protein